MEVMTNVTVDKVVSYSNSRFFPWNILMEPVDMAAIEHYMPLAVQAAWIKGAYRSLDGIQHLIMEDVRMVVKDYLLTPYSKGAEEVHREFADDYPFAYTQALVTARLCNTSDDLKLGDIIDIEQIGSLVGVDVGEFRRREDQIRKFVSIYQKQMKKPRSFTKRIINQKVVSTDGEIIGVVKDIVFDFDTGDLVELLVTPKKGVDKSKFRSIREKEEDEGLMQQVMRAIRSLLKAHVSKDKLDLLEYEPYLAGISIEDVYVSLYNEYVVFNR
ncbi:MAG: PRC-barrel domain protein [Candidatus Syntrophoarchaeum caldarius]|uniref:PRC-barrel domain protein n=1 Tax=Candidatus Syntropharchaeum caldarium TaxID=1838285 RepID=A0A1F2P8S0_9EURY|nr:MAG: PRC-barrel domain protein [Candidatus Syntrophoarchaeum caldarius]